MAPGEVLRGIDVSHYQPRVDWQGVASAGFRFAWIKATEGATEINESFAEQWSGAWAAGMLRGAYCFLTTSSPAEEQARLFLRVYPGGGELPLALDLERGVNGGEPSAATALSWVRLVQAETGGRIWIYCSPSFAATHLRGEAGRELAELCGLWLADWNPGPAAAPAPWGAWAARQTGRGRVPGIAGEVDLDVLRPEVLGEMARGAA